MLTLEDLEQVEDPLELFRLASEAISQHRVALDQLAEVRARAAGALYAEGYTYRQLADTLGVSAPRVGQLVAANDTAALEVFRAWAALEKSMAELAAVAGVVDAAHFGSQALHLLQQSPYFSESSLQDLERLRDLRSALVHGATIPTVEDAELAADMAIYLNALLHLAIGDAKRQREGVGVSERMYEDRVVRLVKTRAELATKEAAARNRAAKLQSETQRALASITRNTSESQRSHKERDAARKQKESAAWLAKAAKFATDGARKDDELRRARRSLELERVRALKKQEVEAEKRRETEKRHGKDLEEQERVLALANDRRYSEELRHQQAITREARKQALYAESLRLEEVERLPERVTVLFFASDPRDTERLALDEEARDITRMIRLSRYRDSVDFKTVWAVRPLDLMLAMNEHQPHVVHISGHGSRTDEVIFMDDAGAAKPVRNEAVTQMLAATATNLRVVVFNTCYSHAQAEAIASQVEAAIGMTTAISDRAARIFAAQFYSAIGFGYSVERAFHQARAAVMAEGLLEEDTPELFVRPGGDADEVVLVRSEGIKRAAGA